MDAELNLPEGGYSYLLQEWGTCLSTEQPYEKAATFLNAFLDMQIWNSSLEEIARKSSKNVNDRFEQTGMHWSIEGANALLSLRSIHINNLASDYWRFHQEKEKERLYGRLAGSMDMRLAA